ncbi:PKD domain-containing protein [Kineosporia rhizophila]|uniref:PKD domain-containing protein n=1 Tax=Kineosporia rhizophila TaxID=84633 RepID=UPI001E48EF76|nr:PKD domain-containing protein [Kineosporia rhizophila]
MVTATGAPQPNARVAAATGGVSGTVYEDSIAPGNVLADSFVQICPSWRPTGTDSRSNTPSSSNDSSDGQCETTSSNSAGTYSFTDLAPGDYYLSAYPPANSTAEPGGRQVTVPEAGGMQTGQDIVLNVLAPPPAGTTITNIGTNPQGVPTVYWGEPLTLRTHGCEGAVATWELLQDSEVRLSGTLTEGVDGEYTTIIAPIQPVHGYATFVIRLECPNGPPTTVSFDVYIDPSGHVVDTEGNPVEDAVVTLYRSENYDGPFTVVPDGSRIMSPANRRNPSLTNENGYFGWDVVAGYYQVRAQHAGCVSADDPSLPYALSYTMTIPPPVTDLWLVLDCANGSPLAPDLEVKTTEDVSAQVDLKAKVSDPDGDPVTITSTSTPAHGDLSCTSAWVCTFAPSPDYNGSDSFTYTVSDGKGGTATGTVKLSVSAVNDLPTAAFTVNPTSGNAPLAVRFDGHSSVDVEGIATYAWEFGDGTTGTGAVVDHTYAKAGSYTAKLTVTDSDGAKDVSSAAVTVNATQPPKMRDSLTMDRSGTRSYRFGGELESGDFVFTYKKGKLQGIDGVGVIEGRKVDFDVRANSGGRAHGRITVADAKTGKIFDRIRVRGTYPVQDGLTFTGTSIWGKNGQQLDRLVWSVTDVPKN